MAGSARRLNDTSVRNTIKKVLSRFKRVINTKRLGGLKTDVYTVSFTLKYRTGS
jgi:hypothetical protein